MVGRRRKFFSLDRLFQSLSNLITLDLHLTLKDFHKKRTTLSKNYVKNYLKINHAEYRIHAEKYHMHAEKYICFNKKSTNLTFTFISSKVV